MRFDAEAGYHFAGRILNPPGAMERRTEQITDQHLGSRIRLKTRMRRITFEWPLCYPLACKVVRRSMRMRLRKVGILNDRSIDGDGER